MEIIKLYTPDDVEIPLFSYAENRVITDAKCTRVFQGEESITIQIESAKHLSIPLYSYVDFRGVRYRMNRISEVENVWNDVLEYRIELESVRYELGRVLFDTSIDPAQAALEKVYSGGSFGNLYHFADLLASNLKRALGATWRIEGVNQNDKGGQLLSFERSENCLSALHKIAQAFHVVFFTSEDVMTGVRTLRFVSEYEYDPSPIAEWHVGNEIFSCNRKNVVTDNIVTRLWCFGSEEGAEKAGDRLTLPAKNTTNSYIEDPEKVRLYGLSEGLYIDEEAKPTYTGSVSKITSDPLTFHSPAWSLFSKLQDGETARIHFETGNLQGMEFSVKRVSDGKITINPIVDNDLKIQYPSKDVGSAYSIAVGDTFKCLGINYPLNLVLDAQDRLQASATLRYNEVSVSRLEYDLVMREGLDFDIAVGDVVTIVGDCIPSGRANLMIQQTEINLLSGEFAVLVSKFARKRRIQEVYDSWKDRLRKILGDRMASDTHREFILDVDKRIELLVQEDENISRIVELKEDREVALSRYKGLTEEISKRVTTAEFTEKVETLVSKQALANDLKGYVVNREFDNLKTIVHNEISAWTVEGVPHLVNRDIAASDIAKINSEPYNSWGKAGTDRKLEAHVGDTWLVNKAEATENGKMYRFVKGSKQNTYRWVQLSDSPAVVALNEAKRLSEVVDDTKVEFLARLGDKVTAEFTARKAELKGDKGDAGQDAAPVRPNLIKRGESLYPNMGQSADNVSVAYKDGVYRITKHDKMWRTITMYTRPLLPQKSTKTRIVSWRVVGASRPELLNEHQIKSKGGRYYTVGNLNHEEQWVRGGVYAYPFDGEENHWIDGDWVEFADIKVELVEDGEPLEPTTYLPHIDDLKGDSVTALQVVAELNKTDIFKLSVRDALKLDTDFVARTKGEKGDSVTLADLDIRWDDDKLLIGGAKSESLKGQDAPPIRPNLLRGFMGAEKTTTSAVGSANVHTRLDIKPFLEAGKKYILSADFELIEGTANAVSIGLLTTSENFLIETKNPLSGTKTRVSLQIGLDASATIDEIVDVLGYAGERGKARGNLARYYNIKLEEVTSDSDKASAYLPHPNDLKGAEGKSPTPQEVAGVINTPAWQALLADQTANRIVGSNSHLSIIREGMATAQSLNQLSESVGAIENHMKQMDAVDEELIHRQEAVGEWIGVQKIAIDSINQGIEHLSTGLGDHTIKLQSHDNKLQEFVSKDVTTFAYYDNHTWSDYTNEEYVGGGHHPDPWGGVGDGYMRTVHNYETYNSVDSMPPTIIDNNKKTLKNGEYTIGDKQHRDNSALIIYSFQSISSLNQGEARHWRIFSSSHNETILRFGGDTDGSSIQGAQHHNSGYWNLSLDKSTTCDIYVHNLNGYPYRVYVIKNGEYK